LLQISKFLATVRALPFSFFPVNFIFIRQTALLSSAVFDRAVGAPVSSSWTNRILWNSTGASVESESRQWAYVWSLIHMQTQQCAM